MARKLKLAKAPPAIRDAVALSAGYDEGAIDAMKKRRGEFSTSMAATLAGIAVQREMRVAFEEALNEAWEGAPVPAEANEVIVGAGLHAAIYSAVRVAQGFARPLVLESSSRAGGAFACSQGPSFYLNSRNRPGQLGLPGENVGLNVIPGGVIQPSDLSGAEFQRNSDLAFAIRCTLGMYANVRTGRNVTKITAENGGYRVSIDDGPLLTAGRVIVARGLGTARGKLPDAPNVLTFPEFMARLDEPFPLRDLKRVAVIGAGDSGKTAIEALVGQSPAEHWSVASLDWVDQIDWYCGPNIPFRDRNSFLQCNRARYKRVGSVLPVDQSLGAYQNARVRIDFTLGRISQGFGRAQVNEKAYDLAIDCTGYDPPLPLFDMTDSDFKPGIVKVENERILARRVEGHELYTIGPCAQLDVLPREQTAIGSALVPENATAIFRYASRTAQLAAGLGRVRQRPAQVKVQLGDETLPSRTVAAVALEIAEKYSSQIADPGSVVRDAAGRYARKDIGYRRSDEPY